jgi:hypothetical protein
MTASVFVESNILVDEDGVNHCWTRVGSLAPHDALTFACVFLEWCDGEVLERNLVWLTRDRLVPGCPTCLVCLARISDWGIGVVFRATF